MIYTSKKLSTGHMMAKDYFLKRVCKPTSLDNRPLTPQIFYYLDDT